tara:strand:+ start:418 stop:774 length:357 start_codon:yes stop_codon:yes gene_type:complete
MGLDIGFYCDGEEVFYLRNHDGLFEFFADANSGYVDDVYSDFYVTLGTLHLVEAMLEMEFTCRGLVHSDALTELPDEFHKMDAREEEWEQLLRYYPAIVELLRLKIVASGPLICSWSA